MNIKKTIVASLLACMLPAVVMAKDVSIGVSMALFDDNFLTILRTVILFVPLGWLLAQWGLHTFWMTFPITEVLTTLGGLVCYRQFLRREEAHAHASV